MTALSKTYSTFWPLTIVAVVTFVFGGMVVYYTQMARGDNEEMVLAQPLARAHRKPAPTPTLPEGKSFRDVRAGFSFNYPGTWSQDAAADDSVGFHVVLKGPAGESLSAFRYASATSAGEGLQNDDNVLEKVTKSIGGRNWNLVTYEDRANREQAYTSASVVVGGVKYSFTTEQEHAADEFFTAALVTFDLLK